jgi:hypothetical protein
MGTTTESKRGSDCSGSDGAANRVLTLANTALSQTAGFQTFVNGLLLVPTTEYTVAHNLTNSQVTFLNAVFNDQYIIVQYVQGSTTSGYCTYQNVYDKTGLTTTEVSSTLVETFIEDAAAEIEQLTGRLWTSGNGKTEILDGPKKDILGTSGTKAITINLKEYPVQSIISFLILNTDGTTNKTYTPLTAASILAGTYDTTDYWLDTLEDPITHNIIPSGKIILKSDEFQVGNRNIKVSYTYGYATMPVPVNNLTKCLAGIRAWIYFIGGSYNYLNSYNLPQQSVNKGDFYQRGMQNIQMLTEESNRLLDRIGRRPRTLYFASGCDR